VLLRVSRALRFWGLKMASGLVWRTVLFLGLTAGYVLLAALPYLA